jgi:hypothetical protein
MASIHEFSNAWKIHGLFFQPLEKRFSEVPMIGNLSLRRHKVAGGFGRRFVLHPKSWLRVMVCVLVGCAVVQPCFGQEDHGATNEDPFSKSNQASYLADAMESVPYVREFFNLYPKAVFKVSADDRQYSCRMIVAVYGRYRLYARIPMKLDLKNKTIVEYGDPRFVITTVQEYEKSPPDAPLRHTRSRHFGFRFDFGAEQWQEIVKAGGDLTFLSPDVATNDPLPEYQQRWREDLDNPGTYWIGIEALDPVTEM